MEDFADLYPLSPLQRGMLYHSLDADGSGVYVQQICLRFDGLDRDAYVRAWERVVERHPILRSTVVGARRERPMQVVHRTLPLRLSEHDCRSLSDEELETWLERERVADRERGFDLSEPPLMRLGLFRVGERDYETVWSFHHILLDGWSVPQLLGELFRFYAAFCKNEDLRLPTPRPYRDYIAWLQHQDADKADGYWREALSGFSEPTSLSVGRSSGGQDGGAESYGQHETVLSEELTSRLGQTARECEVTVNTVLLGAWTLLFSCYSGKQDVLFGTTVSGRPPELRGVESMVGLFINTLPLRVRIPTDAGLGDWLRQLQAQQAEQRSYEYSPLWQVKRHSEVPSDLPLFDSLFVFENFPLQSATRGKELGLGIRFRPTIERSGYPLAVTIVPRERLTLRFIYFDDRFDEETIVRLGSNLSQLLEAIVAQPSARLSDLSPLAEAERSRLLIDWNDTTGNFPRDRGVHELFAEQAEATPDAVAVAFDGTELTYRELNARANQLGSYLKSRGVGPGTKVAICVERSANLVVGLLGILKAGGAYVPLDADYPKARISFMLEDTSTPVLITQESLRSELPQYSGELVCLDTDWPSIAEQPDSDPEDAVDGVALAYVIYTSGSTGRPNGVCVPHRAINRLVLNTDYIELNPDDRVAQMSNVSFDAATFEIWGALLNGARLVGVGSDIALSPTALAEYVRRQQIGVMFVTTALFNQLVREVPDIFAPMRCVLFGGERVDPKWVRQALATGRPERLLHVYGPTETTTFATWHEVHSVPDDATTVPIGRPIRNTTAYILDSQLRPVPVGVRGELYLGGPGVSLGYLDRPELTEKRFVPDRFSGTGTLYRTGDVVRWTSEGAIEFIDRVDSQVKVRGFRIEIEEVQARLHEHPQVSEAFVCVREDERNDKRLVAYLVAPPEREPTVGELREFLRDRLPDYMVPSVFVPLDALPLTPNGKVDQRALPAPDQSRTETGRTYVPPRTPTEETLCEILAGVLKLDRVGVEDNFFELGGDSILSIQVVARARDAGLHLTPRMIFQEQTVGRLTAEVGTGGGVAAEQGAVAGTVPLTPIQAWFFEEDLLDAHYFNQAFLFAVRRPLEPSVLEAAVQRLIAHHDALRLRFTLEDGRWKQEHAEPDASVPFQHVDLTEVPASERSSALEASASELQASLNLEEGPMLRVALYAMGAGEPPRLLVIVHHLVVDMVSWRILREDLQQLCEQLAENEPAELPAKTTSFQEWSSRLSELAESDRITGEASYWRGLPWDAVSPLPLDHPAGQNTVETASAVTVSLDEDETRALLQQVPPVYNSQVNDALLTALGAALAPWLDGDVALVDLEGHGREDIFEDVDLSRTVGWFTAVFPVVLSDLDGTVSPSDVGQRLKATKESLRKIPGRGLGNGLLRYLHGDRPLAEGGSDLQMAQVSFNYLGQLDQMFDEHSLFGRASEPIGSMVSPRGRRAHLLDVNASVVGGRLHVGWTFSTAVHERSTIEGLAERFVSALREIIAHCQAPGAGGRTPSDFPHATIEQDALEQLEAELGRDEIAALYDLSPMQRGMLSHSFQQRESGAYLLQMQQSLDGLEVEPFLRAWKAVIARHAALRTSILFPESATPVQLVRREVPLALFEQDCRELDEEAQRRTVERFRREDLERGFELTEPTLMRIALIRLGERRYEAVWSFHHIILDGWSLPIVLGEVFKHYAAFCRGETIGLPSPRPYGEYIGWLKQHDLNQAESFWREQLAGFEAPTAIPLDRGTAGEHQVVERYGEKEVLLSAETTKRLKDLAARYQVTLNTISVGAWSLLLARYSGDDEVVLGTTVSGRPPELPGVETMVGLFINTLPLRAGTAPDMQLEDWLKALQARQVELQSYEYSPLWQVQQWSDVPGGVRLFDTLFIFENYPVDPVKVTAESELKVRGKPGTERTGYPLLLLVMAQEQLYARLTYDADRFDESSIDRMTGHYQRVLEGIAEHPTARLREIPMLADEERRQLLEGWNQTVAQYPRDLCVHHLVEAHAAERPDRVAAVLGEDSLTYGELDRRANQLANHLQSIGVGPGDRVGVFVERGLPMLSGLLGVLKSGAAYVPLDPSYPVDRVGFMVSDAEVRVLLTTSELADRAPAHDAEVVCLDTDGERIGAQSAERPERGAGPEDLAYVIYTSGSTGRPKGVEIPHRAVVNFLASMSREPGLSDDDVLLSVTTLSFDIAVLELFLPLSVGARVVLASREEAVDGVALGELLAAVGATVMQATPTTWRLLLQSGWTGDGRLGALVGGEAWGFDLAESLLERCGSVWNMYGPTETTIWSATRQVRADDGRVLIGGPIANTQLYVLDAHRQPVPVGVPGELYIGGDGLARGYWKRSELTAERFPDDPFSDVPGARLYRTGDLVRYREDCTIEFLGRLDHQVKLRGYRIELGEIEAVLDRHAAVDSAVVIVREDTPGDQRLVAYLVPGDGEVPPASELRVLLRDALPDYMVPAAFVTLEALPLTPNGKVDRKALPAPDSGSRDDTTDWVEPRTPVEELLASLWSSVLGVERVGAQDNFFTLGGHSLLATQLVSRIRDALDVELPLNEVFHTPTVAELAVKCEDLRGGQVSAVPVTGPIPRAPRDGELPLSFGQERFWFLEQMQPGTAALNMHGTVHMEGELDRDAFREALKELVRRHEVLRTSIPEGAEGQPVQRIAEPESFALPETDLTNLQGAEQEAEWRRIAGEQLRTPLDIAAGPLVRTALLRLGERDHVFLLTLHHMVADAWSLGIFWRELATLYRAFSTSAPSPLEELPIQYLDFSSWQRSWLDDDRLQGSLDYWSRQLEGVPPLLDLPTDHPRPPVQTFNGAEMHYALGPELSGALKQLAAARGATLFMTLLAGFKAVLQRYSGQSDLVIGTPIAGRTRSEAEGLIGLFANSLVLRTDLSDDPSFGDLLHRVRAVSLDAYANQDLPFERLVQVLHPPRETSHHPLFQVMFVLQNAPTQAHGGFPGLSLRLKGGERVTSQFDLTLYAWEAGPQIVLNAEYKTDLFEEPTIARLLSHLERLLAEAVSDPERPLSELPLLTDDERERLLVTWNQTESDYPRDATLHGLVERQVEATPDAIAAVFEGEQLTYRELDERAARLARHLRAGGVGSGSRVGICLERGLPMLVGLLGVLKAGAAYVPLDPSHPEDRIGFILSDAAIDALVSQADLVDRLDAGGAAVICLDSEGVAQNGGVAPMGDGETAELPVSVAPDDLAYVIYTSGSTGRPKGVEVHHRGVVNFLASMQREPGLTAEDVLLSVTTMSFDIAVLEVFLPLTVGARVVLVPPEVAADGLRLETALTHSRATVMQATPTTWQILLEARWPGDHRLKALVGGEAWSRSLADALLPRCGSLWNMYGPTETTIWSAVQRVEPGPAPVAIGPPIANTQLYVLDQQGAPVPVGVPGELYIGGDGVARGYWNRPELTAERFLEDPFASAPGGRFYRTGDLVRYRDDRTIQFMGRLDHQVKVRGFRIELGEIEWLLSQHEGVREVVVVAYQFGPDDTRLIGYVALAPESPPEPSDLQALLRERLPDYMVPSAFVTLDALPRTPNGKLDRAALPAPDLTRSSSRGEQLPPSTHSEKLLAEIWEDLLGVGGVGMQDNFFDLGGHSLLAMRVVARLEKASGVRINPGELILQTLMQVAAVCDAATAESPAAESAEPVAAGPAPASRGRMLGSLRRLFTRKRDS